MRYIQYSSVLVGTTNQSLFILLSDINPTVYQNCISYLERCVQSNFKLAFPFDIAEGESLLHNDS